MTNSHNIDKNKICVLGLGYVGLTLSATLAKLEFNVVGVDKDEKIISNLKNHKSHFHEKGLDELLLNISNCETPITYLNKLDKSCADIYIITVGTPILRPSLKPNIDYVKNASVEVANVLKSGDLVILRSTVPVGTTRDVVLPILEEKSGLNVGKDFSIAFCPERTVEGKALNELRQLPQIIGGFDNKSYSIANNLFNKLTPTIIDLDSIESAEMLKIMDNTYRDTMFGYANHMALVCDKLGLDIVPIVQAANQGYNRNNIPVPSPGVGGACLSKDPYILAEVCNNVEIDPEIIIAARRINEFMPIHIVNKLSDSLEKNNRNLSERKIFVLGFAFKGKPETSDMRDSPTLDLVKELKLKGAEIYGHDPLVDKKEIEELGISFVDLQFGFEIADVIIVMINHEFYEDLNLSDFISNDKELIIIDGWSMFENRISEDYNNLTYLTI